MIAIPHWRLISSLMAITMGLGACGREAQVSADAAAKASSLSAGLQSGSVYEIASVQTGQSLDVVGVSQDDGAQVQEWPYGVRANQQWQVESLPDGYFLLISVNSGKALDLTNNSGQQGTILQQWTRSGGLNQEWQLEQQSDGSYTVVSASSGQCMDVINGSSTPGTRVQQWPCWGGAMQKWQFVPVNGAASTGTSAPPPSTGGAAGLHTAGTQLLNAANQVVQLRGVNIASLVWTDTGELPGTTNPPPCYAGQTLLDSIDAAMTDWHANHIRLAINPDRWWNTTGEALQIRALVDSIVALVASNGGTINLDMHVSDAGVWGGATTQHGLPDVNTQTVLADIAHRYANNPAVMFGLYNEPQQISWDVWLNGGSVTDITGTTFQGIGMQAMYDTVRAAGANNVVIIDGIDWASQLQGIVNGYAVSGTNIMYDAHVYPGVGTVADWDAKVGVVGAQFPLYIGEFGNWADGDSNNAPWPSGSSYIQSLLQWIAQHNYSFAAWTFGPDAPPTLLSDWCYTPSSYYGAAVKQFLAQ